MAWTATSAASLTASSLMVIEARLESLVRAASHKAVRSATTSG